MYTYTAERRDVLYTYTAERRDVLYTYTAERRDVLGCTSPTTKRFPEALEMSLGLRPREIPWVSGCKTHGQGKSRGRRGWISQYLPSLGGARTFSHHYQGRIAPLLQCRPLVVAFKLKLTPSSCYSIDDILSCFIIQLNEQIHLYLI